MSMPGGIGLGVGVSAAITLLLCWLISWLIASERVGENAIGYAAMTILLVSAYVGALLAAARIKHQKMMICLLSGAAYFAVLLACTALFFGGQYQGVGISALLIAAGSIAAAMTDAGIVGGKNKKRKKKHRYR